MLSRSFKIVAPEVFELYIEDINIKEDEALIEINKAAICKADIRYYKGKREERILGLKYPMSLIHEVTGTVIKDNANSLKQGDKVVLVPNVVENYDDLSSEQLKVCENKYLGENYCNGSEFCSSSRDGFSKQFVAIKSRNLIKVEYDISDNILVFSELISVAISAIRRMDYTSRNYKELYIWGDGIVGYIISSVAKHILNKNVTVIGKHNEKLKEFPCDNYVNISNEIALKNIHLENIIECVGGKGMNSAINQILELAVPGAKIVLTGVSEEKIEINTRKILEKGLTITGSTRSNIDDFKKAVDYLKDYNFRKIIKKLVIGEIDIKDISDFYYAFERTCSNNILGKYIMNFKF